MNIMFQKGEKILDDDGALIATVARDIIAGDDPFEARNFDLETGEAVIGALMPEPIRRFVLIRMGHPYEKPSWTPSNSALSMLWERAHGSSYQAIAKKYGRSSRLKKQWGWAKKNIEGTLNRMRHFGMTATWGQHASD